MKKRKQNKERKEQSRTSLCTIPQFLDLSVCQRATLSSNLYTLFQVILETKLHLLGLTNFITSHLYQLTQNKEFRMVLENYCCSLVLKAVKYFDTQTFHT